MGDMADFINESDPSDFYDNGGQCECRYCGEDNLHWDWDSEGGGRWRLYDGDGVLHQCPEVQLDEKG